MSNSWKSKSRFSKVRSELAQLEKQEFARAILPMLKLLDEGIHLTQEQGTFDTSGIDFCTEGVAERPRWAVQCKGFHVAEEELGEVQVRQCARSISTLKKSNCKPLRYTMVYNRRDRDRRFRDRVCSMLEPLQELDIQPELWSLDDLLVNVFNELERRLEIEASVAGNRIKEQLISHHGEIKSEIVDYIPFKLQKLTTDHTQFIVEDTQDPKNRGALDVLQESNGDHFHLILGDFGVGKTTLAERVALEVSLSDDRQHVLFIPAANLPASARGAKEVQFALMPVAAVLEKIEDAGRWIESILATVAANLLERNDSSIVLIVDGLDESQLLALPNGFAYLFDCLAPVRAAIILTMRLEFWERRRLEFEAAFTGRIGPGKPQGHRRRRGNVVTLELWNNRQIAEYIDLVSANRGGGVHLDVLSELKALVLDGGYHSLYGDIPRRPLFLKMLVDLVIDGGVKETGRVALFLGWIRMKTRRDIMAPRTGVGARIGIVDAREVADLTEEIAMNAMLLAAKDMWGE